jgi:glutaredoxin
MQNENLSKPKAYLKDAFLLLAIAVLAGVLGSQLPQWYKAWQGPTKRGDYSMYVKSQPYRLNLYGTSTCPHCESARNYLKQAGIPYNDLIIDQSEAAKVAYLQLGEKAVPILLSADKLIVGYSRTAYAEMAESIRVK